MTDAWIPTAIKVPPYGQLVLCLAKFDGGGSAHWIGERTQTNARGEWWSLRGLNPTFDPTQAVTHWMPLPEKP